MFTMLRRINWQPGPLHQKNEAGPNPDEIPEEHEADNKESTIRDDDRMEQGKDDEVNYKEPKEITPPSPEGEPDTTNAT